MLKEGAIRRQTAAYIVTRRARLPWQAAFCRELRLHGRVLRVAPRRSAAAAHPPRGRDGARRRTHRLPDRFLLRARLAHRRQARARARAPHPPGRPSSSFHAGVRAIWREVGPLRAPRYLAVPHAARLPARARTPFCCAPRARRRAACSTSGGAPSACASPITRCRACCSPSCGEPLMSSTLLLAADAAAAHLGARDPGAPRARHRRHPRRRRLRHRAHDGRRSVGNTAGHRAPGQGRRSARSPGVRYNSLA